MTHGISTARAHLTGLDPFLPEAGEINWDIVAQFVNPNPLASPPAFAGRYFLGSATQEEANTDVPFCLWAHGEARGHGEGRLHHAARTSGGPLPLKIAPIQRANPQRQEATGASGIAYARVDATEIARAIDSCLAVGDLELVGTAQILVFLEIADGTGLSNDYWETWSSTIHDAIVTPAKVGARYRTAPMQPLLPAILCGFMVDEATGLYMPEPSVRRVLDFVAPAGQRMHCHGFWARRHRLESTSPVPFDWAMIGEYRQPVRIAGGAIPYMRRVPVRYRRWFDGATDTSIAPGPVRNVMSLLTLDEPAEGFDSNPLGATLTATDWVANRVNDAGDLIETPSQFGVDSSATVTDESATCLATKVITVKRLSYHWVLTPVNIGDRCGFFFRYYRQRGTRQLTAAEGRSLSRNGLAVGACYQRFVRMHEPYPNHNARWADYVRQLVEPFANGLGHDDAVIAFTYAAMVVNQPPYTPIYFSIDFPVGELYTDGNAAGVQTPGINTILRYFRDVRRGYYQHINAHPDRPYYIGVYAHPNTAGELFRHGLVSHFWQPPWGDGTPFPHLNLWQVGMFDTDEVPIDNATLQECIPEGETGQATFWLDINVAWGDPGTFQVF